MPTAWRQFQASQETLREHLQPYNGDDERGDEEQPPEGGGLVEDEDAQQDGAHSPDAGPHGIGGADGEALGGLGEQRHAQHREEEEAPDPRPPRRAVRQFGLAEAEGEAHFTESR